MIKIIAAVGKNMELGKNNGLIWHLPGDLKFFKEQTKGCTVVMGKNTFNSLPKMLPERKHLILTDDNNLNKDIGDSELFFDFESLYKRVKELSCNQDVYIIGGASVYKQFIDIADVIILTEVDASCEDADVYFPLFDKTKYDFDMFGHGKDNGIYYFHVAYHKRRFVDEFYNS